MGISRIYDLAKHLVCLSIKRIVLKSLFFLLLSFSSLSAQASDDPTVNVFYPHSYAEILKNHNGEEFNMVFWSVICSPCLKELQLISQKKLYLNSKFVFIAVDGDDLMADVKKYIHKVGLNNQEHWVFKHTLIDENVNVVDSSWFGVVPRNYFFDYEHNRVRIRGFDAKL